MSEHYSAQRLRRGIAHFLWGKASSALLSFAGFLLVARLLQTSEYGRYVAMVALVELALNLASFGLDWVSTRYVPEYRVRAGGRRLARFVLRLTGLQVLLIGGVGATLWFFAEPVASLVGVEGAGPVLRIYAAYLVLEGASRVLRDQMLSQLLLQGRAQVALVLRHLTWVGACGVLLLSDGQASLLLVASIELFAAGVGLVAAALGLACALRSAAREVSRPHDASWAAPARQEMWVLAVNSYLSFLLNIPARPQVLTLLVTRLAGVDSAALYGFARALADQVLRFLPAELLLGFVRPALVARYVGARDFAALNRQVNLLLTVSLLVLSPLLTLVIGHGYLVVQVLGGEGFGGSAPVLAVMLVGVALFSHRRMLEFVANTVGHPQAISRGSGVMLLVPVLALWSLLMKWPIWVVPSIALAGELLFGYVAMRALRLGGVAYVLPLPALARIVGAVLFSTGVSALLPRSPVDTWLALLTHALLACALTAAAIWYSRPLDADAVAALKVLANSKRNEK